MNLGRMCTLASVALLYGPDQPVHSTTAGSAIRCESLMRTIQYNRLRIVPPDNYRRPPDPSE